MNSESMNPEGQVKTTPRKAKGSQRSKGRAPLILVLRGEYALRLIHLDFTINFSSFIRFLGEKTSCIDNM